MIPEDLDSFHDGDDALFEKLHAHCYGQLTRVIAQFVPDSDDVEDLLQESWWLAYQRRRSLKQLGKFDAWIARIARNVALSHQRRSARGRCVPLTHDLLPDPTPSARESVRAATARQQRLDGVTDVVVGLRPRERIVVLMYYYTQSPVNRIAEDLGVAPGTVKATLFHAREHIRERYGPFRGGGRTAQRLTEWSPPPVARTQLAHS